jgi:hypothetical protein
MEESTNFALTAVLIGNVSSALNNVKCVENTNKISCCGKTKHT